MRSLFFVSLLIGSSVLADPVTVSWTNPTQNTDGSAIPLEGPASLVKVLVEHGSCSATGTSLETKAGEVYVPATVPGAAMSTVIELPIGEHCLRAYAINVSERMSNQSNTVKKTVLAPKPKPVTGLTVS